MARSGSLRHTLAAGALAPREHGYGLLLILIISSLIFQLATSETGLAHILTILLLGGICIASLWTSQARAKPLWIATAIVVVVTGTATIIFAASGEVDATGARIVSLLMVALAPIAIVHGLIRHFREEGRVTVQTMFGVICIYLLIGSLFAFIYGVVDDVGASPLFGADVRGTTSDYLYFSFTTMTTTGYGDFTAHTDVGRSFAITEQLMGQIYLVTVVAVIVGNLSRAATVRPR